MQSLINKAIEAHGGMKRWNEVREISVIAVPDGVALHLDRKSVV